MAEHAVNFMASAVTGELISRVLSGLIQKCGKHAATSEKLQRLEMLLIKIHSSIEASEKCTIENSWLLQWRDKLKEAALQGDDVLAIFLQRANDTQATSNTVANQQQGEASSSSAAAPATAVGALPSTRNSPSSIAQGINSASKMLFLSGDADMERLDMILARLEKLSPDIGEFIRLLHLEALPKVVRLHESTTKMRRMRPNTNMRRTISRASLFSFSPPKEENSKRVALEFFLLTPKEVKTEREAHEFCLSRIDDIDESLVIALECDSSVLRNEQQYMRLEHRLEVAFTAICKAVELAGSHELEDRVWLAYWTGILREAKQQGCAVLGAISSYKTINTKDNEPMVEFDQEKDELSSFVHRLEGLAIDVEHFKKLVYLLRAS